MGDGTMMFLASLVLTRVEIISLTSIRKTEVSRYSIRFVLCR